MNPELIVMAAGMGSRYGGLKQLDGVGPAGERLLDYSLYDAKQAGFGRVIFVIRRAFEEAFREHVLKPVSRHIEAEVVFQELDAIPAGIPIAPDRAKPWGTGHAILCCRDAVRAPFAVINADDFYGRHAIQQLARFLRTADPAAPSFALVGYRVDQTLSAHGAVSRGVCAVTPEGRLRGIEEWTQIRAEGGAIVARRQSEARTLDSATPVSMNCWGFTPALFAPLAAAFESFLWRNGCDPKAEFFIPTLVDDMLKTQRAEVWVLETESRWMGLTYPEDRDEVCQGIRALISAGAYPSPIWQGNEDPTASHEAIAEAARSVHHPTDQSQQSR